MELSIQTVYDRNTRRRTIKVYAGVYAGFATLAFAREPSAKTKKCKDDETARGGPEHATSHAHGLSVTAKPIAACPYICGHSTNPVKKILSLSCHTEKCANYVQM